MRYIRVSATLLYTGFRLASPLLPADQQGAMAVTSRVTAPLPRMSLFLVKIEALLRFHHMGRTQSETASPAGKQLNDARLPANSERELRRTSPVLSFGLRFGAGGTRGESGRAGRAAVHSGSVHHQQHHHLARHRLGACHLFPDLFTCSPTISPKQCCGSIQIYRSHTGRHK